MTIYANLISHTQISQKLSKVAFKLTDQVSHCDDIHGAIANALPSGMSVVGGSFYPHASGNNIVAGFVVQQNEKIGLDEANKRGFVTASANVLIDSTTNEQWDVSYDEELQETLVIRQDSGDAKSLLSAIQTSSPYSAITQTAEASQVASLNDTGDFVFASFVNEDGTLVTASLAGSDAVGAFLVDSYGIGYSCNIAQLASLTTMSVAEVAQSNAEATSTSVDTQLASMANKFPVSPSNADDAIKFYEELYAYCGNLAKDVKSRLNTASVA